MTEPTDAEIRELAATGNGVYQDDETAIWEITDPSLLKLVHAALAKWGQPAQAAESVGRDADRIVKWSDRIQRAHPKSEPEFWPDALRVKYMADEIRDLRAARAPADSVQEDAARYRWLRKQDWFDSTLCVLRDPKTVLTRGPQLGADCPSGTRLDAAIDAERTK